MHPYGGTPLCPRCSKAVYAAEQVLGPGRKLYHKPCLACLVCNKRLDSYNLVEHNQDPYCKNCHVRTFGTVDLRHANLPAAPASPTAAASALPSPPTSPVRRYASPPPRPVFLNGASSPSSDTSDGEEGAVQWRRARSPPPLSPSATAGSIARGALLRANRSLSPKASSFAVPEPATPPTIPEEPEHATQPTIPEYEEPEPFRRDIARESAPNYGYGAARGSLDSARPASTVGPAMAKSFSLPPLQPTMTGSRYGMALQGGSGALQPMHTGRQWGGTNPQCPKCGKSVYFAEQVKAVGKTFHKNCLRCTSCATTLAAGRLSEHEGVPYCHRCYSSVHGPAGSGYALLGKAGG